jgi:hypothetical protein
MLIQNNALDPSATRICRHTAIRKSRKLNSISQMSLPIWNALGSISKMQRGSWAFYGGT